jgi:hypothetical protein
VGIVRGLFRPLLILAAGWVGSAACDVYSGTELPLPGFAQAGDPPVAGGGSGADATTPESPSDAGDDSGASNGGTSAAPSAGSSGMSGDAGSSEPGGNGGAVANGGSAGATGASGTAGTGGSAGAGGSIEAAGNGGKTGAGGAAGVGGGGTVSTCTQHPLSPRSTWTATASSSDNGSPPSNVFDGNLDDRWSTGLQQTNADWLQLDFGAVVGIDRVTLELGNNPSDFPRGYAVRFSNTSNNFAAPVLLSGAGQQATDTVLSFATPVSGRYLLIAQTGSVKALWWSIAELVVACSH